MSLEKMTLQTKSYKSISFFKWVFANLFLVLVLFLEPVLSGERVEYLPGYDGKLPFVLETGYITVTDSEFFYYFIESQGNPHKDPLFLWLTGGPGCSGFNGLIYETGPMQFDIDNYNGGLPNLLPYEYAWTKSASIIFVDLPVGTGFSYSTTQEGWYSSDSKSHVQAYEFLRTWLIQHPKYLPLQLFVGGDSYSGMIVPVVTKYIIEGNEAKIEPILNIMGYLIGSPTTDNITDNNSKIDFAHRMALISDETYEKAQTACGGTYVNVDPANTECVAALEDYKRCTHDLFQKHILEPKCVYASPNHEGHHSRRSLQADSNQEFILSPPKYTEFWCQTFNYIPSYVWANDDTVREALHVRAGTIQDWPRCNKSLSYTKDVASVVEVHRYLSTKGMEVLAESGDQDLVVPFCGTEKWINTLNLTIVNDWRPWFVNGQVAGYTRKYSEHGYRLTFATVKGAGHVAPEYKRRECYEMFDRWIHYYPL